MKTFRIFLYFLMFWTFSTNVAFSQTESIARRWNNIVLEGIRNDYARPTVHARNLFHHSIICYDGWAAYNPSKSLFLLGNTINGYSCQYDTITLPGNVDEARTISISYASYRFIQNRYSGSPDYNATLLLANELMQELGLDPSISSTDYLNDGPAALGNYLAAEMQAFGLTDGSNEVNGFDNQFYTQLNPPLEMAQPGNPSIQDPNHWQPLELDQLIDQSGNIITTTQPHLSPEWGNVYPFALDTSSANQLTRDGMTFNVYFDSLQPAYLYDGDSSDWDSFYKWNHTLVSVWQSHLDPSDGVLWDISPASIGNNQWYPADSTTYASFYDLVNGGDPGIGHAINPSTGMAYAPQVVSRADYARVLAEFWADGIDSETPPGHWFEIYHYVTDQPSFERKWKGVGPILSDLEYDVKAHLALGGTMHDAAIAAWSLKGYYDYLRPVSAIRYMADQGQSSDVNASNYNPNGIPLMAGNVELVEIGDPLAGQWNENVGKIKLNTWKGHDYINNPQIEIAGVGWILAENWWPYQRPTFVTPPFAGFVSGHSTFSRAAAHTMEFMTGDAFFPGGMGEFIAPMNEFLQFEEGPSDTIRLQWATYLDASDQCSLSRIWGGIHPPIDDIPGRMIGDVVGPQASMLADSIFSLNNEALTLAFSTDSLLNCDDIGNDFNLHFEFSIPMDTSAIPVLNLLTGSLNSAIAIQNSYWLDSTELIYTITVISSSIEITESYIELENLVSGSSTNLPTYNFKDIFFVDTRKPAVEDVMSNISMINDVASATQMLNLTIAFDEPCDTSIVPNIELFGLNYLNPTLTINSGASSWQNDTSYSAVYTISDYNETVNQINLSIQNVFDLNSNQMDSVAINAPFSIDTENPYIVNFVQEDTLLTQENLLSPSTNISVTFSETMDVISPILAQIDINGTAYPGVQFNPSSSIWHSSDSVLLNFLLYPSILNLTKLELSNLSFRDSAGNALITNQIDSVLWTDMKPPEVLNIQPNVDLIGDSMVGPANYFVDVSFDESMDTSLVPLVLHSASQSTNGSIQYNVPLSGYLNDSTYRAFYQILDENIEIDEIDIQASYARDASGNGMTTHVESDLVDLDTRNPELVGFFANTSVLNQVNQTWEVIAVYDEPMRQSIYPSIQLSTIPFNFPMVNSGWLNATSFAFVNEVQGTSPQLTLVDIEIDAAKDIAGNNQSVFTQDEILTIHPLLELSEISDKAINLFPNPVKSGDVLILNGWGSEVESFEVACSNAMGQLLRPIQFRKQGGSYISESIQLSTGYYLLKIENLTFKLIVR